LSPEEKLMLLTELWDELTAQYDEVGLSPEQEGLLDRRMEKSSSREAIGTNSPGSTKWTLQSSNKHLVVSTMYEAGTCNAFAYNSLIGVRLRLTSEETTSCTHRFIRLKPQAKRNP
jgi:hypothetical protein